MTGGDSPVGGALVIRNEKGLHARAAGKFVKLVATFDAEIIVTKGDQTVSGRSILGLMMLAAGPGTTIEVSATGPQAPEAFAAVSALVEARFHE